MKRWLMILLCLFTLTGVATAEIKTTSRVRLRTGPNTEYRIVATVPKGTLLTDLDSIQYDAQERPWYWVEWKGQECWVCGDYAVVTSAKESNAQSGDPLAESRWISVSVQGADGAEAYPSNYGGSELWLFPDGVAHWQVNNAEGLLSRNPVGRWEKTGEHSLIFFQAENLETAREEQMQRFEITSDGLTTPWDNDLTIRLTPYDVLDRWLPLSRDSMQGEWVLYAGETEGWEYTAEEEGINATFRFTESPSGNLSYHSNWNGREKKGTAEYCLNDSSDGSDLQTAWAPWYFCMDRQENEHTYAFLPNAYMLRVERYYNLDGIPAISTQDYMRKN